MPPPSAILDRYFIASQAQQSRLRGMQMDMEIDAQLPKLKKQGRLHALRHISRVGKVTYDAVRFVGDNTIKNEVIRRYLNGENEAQGQDPTELAISYQNYKFKYKGLESKDGQTVYVFDLKPRHKKVGLFKGELWLDPETCLPLRASGQFVKSPSIFLKRIAFVREYEIRDGVAVPKYIESEIDTRIVGRAELNISYSNITRTEPEQALASPAADSQ